MRLLVLLSLLASSPVMECIVFSSSTGAGGFGAVAAGWRVGPRAAADRLLTLHVFLKHAPDAEAQLVTALWNSASPTSPLYGKHMSFAAVNSLLRPAPGAVEAVQRWLGDVEKQVAMNAAEDIWQARCSESALPGSRQFEMLSMLSSAR